MIKNVFIKEATCFGRPPSSRIKWVQMSNDFHIIWSNIQVKKVKTIKWFFLTFCWPCTYRCDDTRGCVMQFWPPNDEHMCSKHVEAWNNLIVKQKCCASSWLISEINVHMGHWQFAFLLCVVHIGQLFQPEHKAAVSPFTVWNDCNNKIPSSSLSTMFVFNCSFQFAWDPVCNWQPRLT